MLKQLLPVALIMLGIISYFVLATVFGIYQAVPWLHYAMVLGGTFWLARLAVEKRKVLPWISTVTGAVFSVLFMWYTLSYSAYAPRQLAVQEGQVIDALTTLQLPDQDGQPTTLLDGASRATLVVLYRGYW